MPGRQEDTCMPFADSEGTRIYYDDRGTGEPVLLCLPGWCVHHTMFVPLAERLSAHHRVLAMDWRGHGKSPSPKPMGERVPKMIFTSWNPIFISGNPLAPPFLAAMPSLQENARWRETVERLLTMWLSDAPASVATQIRNEMGSHGFEDWARAGREIAAVYAREGDPLQALSTFRPSVPVLHVY